MNKYNLFKLYDSYFKLEKLFKIIKKENCSFDTIKINKKVKISIIIFGNKYDRYIYKNLEKEYEYLDFFELEQFILISLHYNKFKYFYNLKNYIKKIIGECLSEIF